jgi:hypothetical protein
MSSSEELQKSVNSILPGLARHFLLFILNPILIFVVMNLEYLSLTYYQMPLRRLR